MMDELQDMYKERVTQIQRALEYAMGVMAGQDKQTKIGKDYMQMAHNGHGCITMLCEENKDQAARIKELEGVLQEILEYTELTEISAVRLIESAAKQALQSKQSKE